MSNRNSFFRLAGFIMVLCLLFSVEAVKAVTVKTEDYKKMAQIIAAIKQLNTYSYDFVIKGSFPDGSADQVIGNTWFDGAHRRVLQRSNMAVVMLTDKWFYRADHATQQVSLFSLDRYNKERGKTSDLDDVFNNAMGASFVDSVVLKYGKVTAYSEKTNKISISISFPDELALKKLVLVYNTATGFPESIYMLTSASEGVRNLNGSLRTTTREVFFTHYSRQIPEKLFRTEDYFRVSNGKVALKQYTGYKLNTIL